MPKLTAKQQRFVDEYLIDLNATQAAIRAGYSAKTAGQIGEQNLKKLEIQQAITERNEARQKRTEIDQDYVLMTIRETIERCRQVVPVLTKEGEETGEFKFEPNAVLKGAELLGKHLKMWTDKVEQSGPNGGPIDHSLKIEFIEPK
jgi:phage terminase small subunit